MPSPGTFHIMPSPYGKIDPYVQFQHESRKKERVRVLVIVSASVFLFVAAGSLGIGIGVARSKSHGTSSGSPSPGGNGGSPDLATGSAAVQAACNTTLYPSTCAHTLSAYPGALSADPLHLVIISIEVALAAALESRNLSLALIAHETGLGPTENMSLSDCSEVLDLAADQLNSSISLLSRLDIRSLRDSFREVEILLSTASSEQTACGDGLSSLGGSAIETMRMNQDYLNQLILNALCLVQTLSDLGTDLTSWGSGSGSGSGSSPGSVDSVFFHRHLWEPSIPPWAQRHILLDQDMTPDATVSWDGTGNYLTLRDALENTPVSDDRGGARYVIYIKAGIYDEGPLSVKKSLANLTLVGDGCNATIVTGSANVALQGYTTFRSATLGIAATGFVAKWITFRNTAGPSGHQAVALRSNGETSVFDSCCFEGYQDTLYSSAGKHFYTNCTIAGTVDFIFGNALAIFQNSSLVARQPDEGQQNTYTAQGRKEYVLKTGFSFQGCSLVQGEDLKDSPFEVSTYYGRPWKPYSTTVFMQSYVDSHLDPLGWLSWNLSRPFETTCYYAEYNNSGPGSDITGRADWSCVHPIISVDDADQFTFTGFFGSDTSFLPSDVPFVPGL